MIRTQVYLTKRQKDKLSSIANSTGKRQSELIRDAIDRLIEHASRDRRESVFHEAAGIWKNRKDLPDFRKLRDEWDRS